MIHIVGDAFLYCDTDSVKYLKALMTPEKYAAIEQYNAYREAEAKRHGGFAPKKDGEVVYLGVYEAERDMKKFITLGSKKYCYTDNDGELHLTLSGVHKTKGRDELLEKGGIEAFKPGMVFKKAGGLEAVYNDNDNIITKIGEHTLHIRSNVALIPSTYTLKLDKDYKRLLEYIKEEI